jgi:hypothetical protein
MPPIAPEAPDLSPDEQIEGRDEIRAGRYGMPRDTVEWQAWMYEESLSAIERADALEWLARQPPQGARAIIFDPPYSRYSRRCGAARTARQGASRRRSASCSGHGGLRQGGHAQGHRDVFGDWLLPDLEWICSSTGLREQQHLA